MLSGYLISGLYCKWQIQTDEMSKLRLATTEMNIIPHNQGCQSDGFMVYDGNSTNTPSYGNLISIILKASDIDNS